MSRDSCGILCCHPRCASKLADIRTFMVAICISSMLQTSFSGYSASQATTLEHRFQVSSLVLGSIMTTFEFGYILSVIILSFFTKRLHVPKLVGFSLVCLTSGAYIWASSNFIFKPTKIENINSTNEICNIGEPSVLEKASQKVDPFIGYVIFGQMLIGIGASPMMTVTPPFIDDHVSRDLAPPLIACVYTFAAVGIIFGYGVGALMIQMPKIFPKFFQQQQTDEFNDAWWLGYLILGTMDLILGLFMFMFPKTLAKIGRFAPDPAIDEYFHTSESLQSKMPSIISNNSISEFTNKGEQKLLQENGNCESLLPEKSLINVQNENSRTSFSSNLHRKLNTMKSNLSSSMRKYEVETFHSFLIMFKKLIFNRTYILATLGMCLEMFNMIGFGYFAPKFFETVFQINKLNASISVGIMLVPSGAIGIVIGGLLIKQFKWSSRATSLFILVLSSICLIFVLILLAFACPNVIISGVNSEPFSGVNTSQTNSCNAACNCISDNYSPVCYAEKKISFMSPCHAGCTVSQFNITLNEETYSNCKCLVDGIDLTSEVLHKGVCKNECNSKTTYLIIISIGLLLCGMVQNPLVMITMRSVDLSSRTFALSYQFIVLRLLSYVPSQPLYGMIFDSSCLIDKSEGSGLCKFVDAKALNSRIIWLFASVKLVAFVTYTLLYISLTYDEKKYGKKNLFSQSIKKRELPDNQQSTLNNNSEISIHAGD